jgi:hypothetical protein
MPEAKLPAWALAGLGATQIEVTLALAPFAMSMSMTGMGVPASLWVVVAAGLAGLRRSRPSL